MGPKQTPKNNETIDKYYKPCDKPTTSQGCAMPHTQHQQELTPALHHSLDEKGKEPHATHSFQWCWNDKTPTDITCNQAGTVEDVLKRESAQFRRIAGTKANKNKELVIIRDRKAISSHFPCSLIQNERLTVKYVKAADKLKGSDGKRGSIRHQRKGSSDELVMFHVLTTGDKTVTKIMRNPALKTDIDAITIYAYKGEKVKHALNRDGRLLTTIFKKSCGLSDTETGVTTEMSRLTDDLDGKTFKIKRLKKDIPPESLPSSLDDAYVTQNESQRSDSDGNQGSPQQSTTTESVNDNTPEEKPKIDDNVASGKILGEIPNSKMMQRQLSSRFEGSVKGKKTRQSKLSRIQNLFRVEYGKNAQACSEVKTLKRLMELSDSVCNVRINGRPAGSGFLLFDNFVLTNAHVVKNIYNPSSGQLNERVTVHFSYESLEQVEEGRDSGAKVEEVAGFEYESETKWDWTLLRLGDGQKLPDRLLKHFGFLPQSGGICIIGHPDGGVKKIDPCLIVATDDRNQVVKRHYHENPEGVWLKGSHYGGNQEHIQWVTPRFFEDVAASVYGNTQLLTYESCFYFGSSGSPVFDEHCNVVAMHTGGYTYYNAGGKSQSVIEFGHPLSVIIERVIVQLVERGRFDVLKKYLACDYAQHQNLMTSLKKLVESRNLIAFKNAVYSSVVTNDQSLRAFFDFLLQKGEHVPMDF